MFTPKATASHRTRGNLALMFGEYLERWKLTPDGEPIATPTSRLLPVRWRGSPAMLKIAVSQGGEARRPINGLVEWKGRGAGAGAYGRCDPHVMRRTRSFSANNARNGADDEASRAMCAVLAQLHAPRDPPSPALIPLTEWFDALGPAAEIHGGILCVAAETEADLLATQPSSRPREEMTAN
jgi:streptomycin 6-kinase